MGEYRISEFLISIAKKANKSLDKDKVEAMQKKLLKSSMPYIVVGIVIIVISFAISMSFAFRIGDSNNMKLISLAGVLPGAIIMSIGTFRYRAAKQMYFGADLISELNKTGRKCPSCGENCSDNADFCEKCGAKLLKAKLCSDCGTQNEGDANYCINCGSKLNVQFDANVTNKNFDNKDLADKFGI